MTHPNPAFQIVLLLDVVREMHRLDPAGMQALADHRTPCAERQDSTCPHTAGTFPFLNRILGALGLPCVVPYFDGPNLTGFGLSVPRGEPTPETEQYDNLLQMFQEQVGVISAQADRIRNQASELAALRNAAPPAAS